MAKYRMDIFKPGRKPGHPAPLLWRRHDIYASDDTAAQVEAEDLYRTHADFDEFLPVRQRRKTDLPVPERESLTLQGKGQPPATPARARTISAGRGREDSTPL